MSVTMKAPKGHGGCSVAGAQYKPDKNGEVDVDNAHVTEAMAHGFTIVGDGGDDGGDKEVDLSSLKVADLLVRFRERFQHDAPRGTTKSELIEALERGWDAFSVDELRQAYLDRFSVEAPKELKKADLIDALNAPTGE